MSVTRASVTQKDLIDYLGGTLPPPRQAELDAAFAESDSSAWAVLREMQDAQRRKKSARTPPAQAASTSSASPSASATAGPQSRVLAEPRSPKPRWRDRLTRPVKFTVLTAAVLIGVAIWMSDRLQPAKAEDDKKTATRKQEEGKQDAEAASRMKLEALRLKLEIWRRLQVTVGLIKAKPDAGDEGTVRARATLFYNLLCVHGTNINIENKGVYDHLFPTFTEYQHLTTCQLAVQLVLNTNYPRPSDEKEKAQWQQDRKDANALLSALDKLAAKHVGFWDARDAKAFEAEVLLVYPDLIKNLQPTN